MIQVFRLNTNSLKTDSKLQNKNQRKGHKNQIMNTFYERDRGKGLNGVSTGEDYTNWT